MIRSVLITSRQQSVVQRYHGENIYESFTNKMAMKASWHRNYLTVTLCIASRGKNVAAVFCVDAVVDEWSV